MKRKISILLAVICVSGLFLTACAEKKDNNAGENNVVSGVYNSSLPETFSYDVTIEQIGEDIDQYIEEHNMGIKRDTEEYGELLYEFCFSDCSDLTDTTKRFYEAYAGFPPFPAVRRGFPCRNCASANRRDRRIPENQ